MKLFLEWTAEEKLALARLPATHVETYLCVYSEEGIFDVRNKIHKQSLVDEKEAVAGEYEGRRYWVEDTATVPKEMWQIPVPNYATSKTVQTYNLDEAGMCCVVEFEPSATYFFTGTPVEKAVAWMAQLSKWATKQ